MEMQKSSYLIAKDLNLTVATMGRRCIRVRVGRWFLVRVDLDMQWQTLHAFLTREIGTETLHRHVYLWIRNRTGSNGGSGGDTGIALLTFPLNGHAIECASDTIFARSARLHGDKRDIYIYVYILYIYGKEGRRGMYMSLRR